MRLPDVQEWRAECQCTALVALADTVARIAALGAGATQVERVVVELEGPLSVRLVTHFHARRCGWALRGNGASHRARRGQIAADITDAAMAGRETRRGAAALVAVAVRWAVLLPRQLSERLSSRQPSLFLAPQRLTS